MLNQPNHSTRKRLTIWAEHLASLNLLEEVCLLIVTAGGEAFRLCLVYGLIQSQLLSPSIGNGLLLCTAGLSPFLAA